MPTFLIAGLSLRTVDQFAGPLATTREDKCLNHCGEVCNPPFDMTAIDISESPKVRELAEHVLVQDMKQQGGKLGVPYPAVVYINLASQKLSVARLQQEPDDNMELKEVLVAGAVEEYPPDDMPDRPDDEKAADQHEVASLLQQRLEIALEIRRPRARTLDILRLHQLSQIFPDDRDGVVGRQKPVLGLVEHHAVHQLG